MRMQLILAAAACLVSGCRDIVPTPTAPSATYTATPEFQPPPAAPPASTPVRALTPLTIPTTSPVPIPTTSPVPIPTTSPVPIPTTSPIPIPSVNPAPPPALVVPPAHRPEPHHHKHR